MDRFGLLPPKVRADLEREELVERHARQSKALDAALKDHDPDLSVVWVKENIPAEMAERLHLTPARWHVRRQNSGVQDSYYAIETPSGGYREPDHGVLEEMRSRDLWRQGALEKATHVRDAWAEKRHLEKSLEDEQRLDEMKSDYRAARRVAGENVYKRRWGRK